MGVFDEIKAILSPAGAGAWADLGTMVLFLSCFCLRTQDNASFYLHFFCFRIEL